MLKHYLIVSVRNLLRSKSTTLINIFGLAVSITCFLFIAFYLIDETSFDSIHPNASNIYRVSHSFHSFGEEAVITEARIPGMWTPALKEAMPEIKHYTRLSRFGRPGAVRFEPRSLANVEQEFFWVDSTYTDIFALSMMAGERPAVILNNPAKVIISETMALKYFGPGPPIGQTLIYSRDGVDIPLLVAGVMRNYPSNNHFHPDFLVSNLALTPLWKGDVDRVNSWREAFTYSYIEVEPGADMEKIDRVLRSLLATHLGEDAKAIWPTLVKLTDLHFWPGMQVELESSGDPIYLYLFGSIGILILLIACINYMNLATAKSIQRSKEVGLRKALGVPRGYLILQFLCESVILTSFAIGIAVVLFALLLPSFNDLTSRTLSLSQMLTGKVALSLLTITLLVGILAGSYPAFYLSGFRPLDVLRGKLRAEGGAETFRKSLVIFQFTVTLLLVIGTLTIRRQLAFINETKLSEFKDQIIAVRIFGIVNPKSVTTYGESIQHQSAVQGASIGLQLPKPEGYGWMATRVKVPSLNSAFQTWQKLDMDADFPSLFNLEFVAGRNFSKLLPTDTGKLIINEAAVRSLHISPEKAIGLILEDEFTHLNQEVIGVVKDFSYTSVRSKIEPLIISGQPLEAEVMYIKLNGKDYQGTISLLEHAWKEIVLNAPFQYWFLDKEFERLYQQEKTTGTLFSYFSLLAIFIGCLGLLGLASYTVEQKTKEIGIRKVLGATGYQILLLLTSRFVKLVMISLLVGMPLAYYLMNIWLQRFAYQAELSGYIFALSGSLLLLLTCATVGLESVRAALQDPVKSLRHE